MIRTKKQLLDQINNPKDLKKFNVSELAEISEQLRQETIEVVSETGGHLGAGLGVVELTVALHYVFDAPKDKIVWDIGHQAYPHKIITERKARMSTLRKADGISGFTRRAESEYDTFIGGHGGTAISSAMGMAVARDLFKQDFHVISVIGDGSMTAGMAYEAMNNAGFIKNKMIVILNDNKMSIAPAVGALTTYLSKLISSKPYLCFRKRSKNLFSKMPNWFEKIVKKFERNTKDLINDGNFFEEMGFYYIGPINGHNVEELVALLQNLKEDSSINKPILLHVVTEKGKGFNSASSCNEKYHAVSKFDLNTKKAQKKQDAVPTFTEVFAQTITKLAQDDESIVGITAAMPSGTGLNKFAEIFPNRMFDVGMAEQHAVTFAAGMACEGIKPFVALYSTFLQRAYDQVINDVAIQKLPVRFIVDRAGYVGADGPTHSGSFDLTYLCALPSFIIMCPSDESELALMIKTSCNINDSPSVIRFPRGNAYGVSLPSELIALEIGKARLIQSGSKIAILSLGTRLESVKIAANLLKDKLGHDITIVDSRFAKPIDKELIIELAKSHELIVTVEEGAIGGFSAQVNDLLLNYPVKISNIFYPDVFVEQDTQENMHQKMHMDGVGIFNRIIFTLVNKN
jgi:1-deoxy-D-xylulose-5-phosphate synthase